MIDDVVLSLSYKSSFFLFYMKNDEKGIIKFEVVIKKLNKIIFRIIQKNDINYVITIYFNLILNGKS